VNFVDTCRAIEQLTARCPQTYVVLIEDAANGPAVISALHERVRGLMPVKPKVSRAQSIQPQIEAGQVYLPNPRWPDGSLRPGREWVDDFVATCAVFPKGAHDDDVDALSQLLVRCRQVRSWQERMRMLEAWGFIKTQRIGNEPYRYVLMIDPVVAVEALDKKGLVDESWRATYDARRIATKEAAQSVADKAVGEKVLVMPRAAKK
jgi:predicted phage terminase large subunit-like protein